MYFYFFSLIVLFFSSCQRKYVEKKPFHQRSINDFNLESSTYYPLLCEGVQEMKYSKKTNENEHFFTELDFTLADIEDYLSQNQNTILELVKAIDENKNPIEQAYQNSEDPKEKEILDQFLQVVNLFPVFEKVKIMKEDFSKKATDTYYLNTFLRTHHPDYIDFPMRRKVKALDPMSMMLIGTLAGTFLPNLFGSTDKKEVIASVMSEIKPLLDAIKESMTVMQGNIQALTQLSLTMQQTINKFDSMFVAQQLQIDYIHQLLNNLKPQVAGEKPKNLFKEGKNSTFIRYLIAAIGATGTETEQATLALGDWIEQTHLGNELEKSFDYEIQLLAEQKGERYYHLSYAYKNIDLAKDSVEVIYKRAAFKVNFDYTQVKNINGDFFDHLSIDAKAILKDRIGNEINIGSAEKKYFLTAQNHPAVAFYLPIGGQNRCLKSLEFSHQLTHKAFDPFENYKIKRIIFE